MFSQLKLSTLKWNLFSYRYFYNIHCNCKNELKLKALSLSLNHLVLVEILWFFHRLYRFNLDHIRSLEVHLIRNLGNLFWSRPSCLLRITWFSIPWCFPNHQRNIRIMYLISLLYELYSSSVFSENINYLVNWNQWM